MKPNCERKGRSIQIKKGQHDPKVCTGNCEWRPDLTCYVLLIVIDEARRFY